jgi:hypothetical protein
MSEQAIGAWDDMVGRQVLLQLAASVVLPMWAPDGTGMVMPTFMEQEVEREVRGRKEMVRERIPVQMQFLPAKLLGVSGDTVFVEYTSPVGGLARTGVLRAAVLAISALQGEPPAAPPAAPEPEPPSPLILPGQGQKKLILR